jgi:hypothetical protein
MKRVTVQSFSTESDESWNFAKGCLSRCLENHPNCRPRKEGSDRFYPTRVIDVVCGDNTDIVRLCERLEIHDDSDYVALSHCWGKAPMITLCDPSLSMDGRENAIPIGEFKAGIPISRLPTTFRDAVTVTRRLGIRYVWIDAICIVQNSSQDWKTEAMTMHQVYGNAHCTLAATFSKDGNGGLFKERSPESVNPVYVQPAVS